MEHEDRFPIFKERLNELFVESGKSIPAFAEQMGVSRQAMGFYLNGDRKPDVPILFKICEACNVSADYLLGRSDVKSPSADLKNSMLFTGLSEAAVTSLHNMNAHLDLSGLDFVLQQEELLPAIINNINWCIAAIRKSRSMSAEDLLAELAYTKAARDEGAPAFSIQDRARIFAREASDYLFRILTLALDDTPARKEEP